jgi:lantibiotic modifying enzyme
VTWALGELAAVTGEARFATAVEAGRRYERAWFDPSTNTWPDLRGAADSPARAAPPARPSLWCHGGVGIGLARLALYRLDPEPWLAAEAAAALQSSTAAASTALRAGDAESGLTLCHGLGGTVLLLLAAARSYGENEHLDAARWLAARVLDLLGPDPPAWPSGVRGGAFTPGLMTGLAGALYVLARAAEPCEVAPLSVLGER